MLIAPLRHDVVVRARLFDLLAERPDLTGDALVRAASATAYADWFVHVECARSSRSCCRTRPPVTTFAERVHGAARLLRPSRPAVRPREPRALLCARPRAPCRSPAPPPSATCTSATGANRVALLLRSGSALEPWMYKVRPRLGPLVDNTAVLLRHGALDEAEYVRFLGARFPSGRPGRCRRPSAAVEAVDRDAARSLRDVIGAQWPGPVAEA